MTVVEYGEYANGLSGSTRNRLRGDTRLGSIPRLSATKASLNDIEGGFPFSRMESSKDSPTLVVVRGIALLLVAHVFPDSLFGDMPY